MKEMGKGSELRSEAMADGRQGNRTGVLPTQTEGDGCKGAYGTVNAQPSFIALQETEAGSIRRF